MQRIRNYILLGTGFVMGILAPLAWSTIATQAQQGGSDPSASTNCQTFPQTGHKVCGVFLDYWNGHGGLAQQGYPISETFTETSDLNGKPYTVQYFERAVMEFHPENAAPNNVLLSQLGTYLGKSNYPQGFSKTPGQLPVYDITDGTGAQALKSYYNAINLKDFDRAYNYFQGAPDNVDPSLAPAKAQWQQGYADTASVQLAVGKETDDPGAGNIYASMPAVVIAKHTDGTTATFSGCYVLHRVNSGIPDENPTDYQWHISSAKLTQQQSNASIDTLLSQNCSR